MKLGLFRPGILRLFGILALLLPVLVACGNNTETAEQPSDVPTAEIVSTPETPDVPEDAEPTAVPAPTETPVTEPEEEVAAEELHETDYLNFGVVAHLFYTDHERALQLAQNAGFDWIRQQIHWKDIEDPTKPVEEWGWDQLDIVVEATNRYGLKLLISVVRSPAAYTADGSDGLPEDPATLGNFVEAMALRYGDKVQAYEIWNEQNLAHETGGRIEIEDAGRYVEILIECYNRIKAVNPDAFVVAGAPSSTGVTAPDIAISDMDYYRAMYSYRDGIIDGHFDVQAVHPGGSANPPDTLWPDNPSSAEGWTDHPTFYFRHIENVRDVMVEFGMGEHNMWITEFGWATENVTPGYEFGNQITFEEQAEYITDAIMRTYEEYPWVGNVFLWNLNFAVLWSRQDPPQPLHEQASFGILEGDWSPRPSYLALQELIARLKAEQGRAGE